MNQRVWVKMGGTSEFVINTNNGTPISIGMFLAQTCFTVTSSSLLIELIYKASDSNFEKQCNFPDSWRPVGILCCQLIYLWQASISLFHESTILFRILGQHATKN